MSAKGSNRSGGSERPQSLGPPDPPGSRGRSRDGTFRAHARRAVHLRAFVVHPKAGWQHQTFALDLGLGGARVVLDDQVVVGEELTVSFTAPALWDPLVLKARVAWASPGAPYHVGVAFRHHSAEAAFALYELIVSLGYE